MSAVPIFPFTIYFHHGIPRDQNDLRQPGRVQERLPHRLVHVTDTMGAARGLLNDQERGRGFQQQHQVEMHAFLAGDGRLAEGATRLSSLQ